MARYCPICKIMPILRREVKTCGSPECLTTWRSLTSQQKMALVEASYSTTDLPFLRNDPSGFRTYEPTGQTATSPRPDVPTDPNKTVERDNEFLLKTFGPDAPGVVAPDPKDKEEPK